MLRKTGAGEGAAVVHDTGEKEGRKRERRGERWWWMGGERESYLRYRIYLKHNTQHTPV